MDTVKLTDDQWRCLIVGGYTDAETEWGKPLIVAMVGKNPNYPEFKDWPRVILERHQMDELTDYGERKVPATLTPVGVPITIQTPKK